MVIKLLLTTYPIFIDQCLAWPSSENLLSGDRSWHRDPPLENVQRVKNFGALGLTEPTHRTHTGSCQTESQHWEGEVDMDFHQTGFIFFLLMESHWVVNHFRADPCSGVVCQYKMNSILFLWTFCLILICLNTLFVYFDLHLCGLQGLCVFLGALSFCFCSVFFS